MGRSKTPEIAHRANRTYIFIFYKVSVGRASFTWLTGWNPCDTRRGNSSTAVVSVIFRVCINRFFFYLPETTRVYITSTLINERAVYIFVRSDETGSVHRRNTYRRVRTSCRCFGTILGRSKSNSATSDINQLSATSIFSIARTAAPSPPPNVIGHTKYVFNKTSCNVADGPVPGHMARRCRDQTFKDENYSENRVQRDKTFQRKISKLFGLLRIAA